MAPGGQQDSSSEESECSVVKVIVSPDSKRGRVQPPTSTRRMLAMKKEARQLEEERINRIIIDAGMDPDDLGNLETRKEFADALTASHQEEERRIAFKREAGLIADDENKSDGDANDSRRSVGGMKTQERRISDEENESDDNTKDSRRSDKGRKKREKRKTIEKTREDSTDDDEVGTVSKRIKKIASDTEEGSDVNHVSVTEEATTYTGKEESFPDFNEVMAHHNKGLIKTHVTTGVDRSSSPDFDSIASQYSSGFVSSNAPTYKFYKSKNKRVANESCNVGRDDDDVKIDDASDDDQSSKPSTSQRKTTPGKSQSFLDDAGEKAARAANAAPQKKPMLRKSQSFLDDAGEKADRATKAAPRKSQSILDDAGEKADRVTKAAPSSSVSSTLMNAGTFVKECFTGFASTSPSTSASASASTSAKAEGKNESPAAGTSGYFSTSGVMPEKKTQPASSKRQSDSTLTLVKQLLGDPKRMVKFGEWGAWFDAQAALTPKEWTETEEGVLTIQCLPNVTLVPGTLIVDTQAAPPKTALTRATQGGFQPLRSCRLRQPLLGTAQAVAKVTEDPDSGDDFQPTLPLKRRVQLSTKKSDSVISIEDEEPEAADQSCPVCNKFFPAKQIENHVDKCLSSQERKGSGSGDEGNQTVRVRGRKRAVDDVDFLQR